MSHVTYLKSKLVAVEFEGEDGEAPRIQIGPGPTRTNFRFSCRVPSKEEGLLMVHPLGRDPASVHYILVRIDDPHPVEYATIELSRIMIDRKKQPIARHKVNLWPFLPGELYRGTLVRGKTVEPGGLVEMEGVSYHSRKVRGSEMMMIWTPRAVFDRVYLPTARKKRILEVEKKQEKY